MCLTNLHFLYVSRSMASASSIWKALPAYTLQVRLFGDPHLAKRSPNYKRIGSVSRRSKGRNCKITSVAYMCSTVPDQAERRWLVSRILRVVGTARRHLWVSNDKQHLPGRCTLFIQLMTQSNRADHFSLDIYSKIARARANGRRVMECEL
jgi:hypothetical protein